MQSLIRTTRSSPLRILDIQCKRGYKPSFPLRSNHNSNRTFLGLGLAGVVGGGVVLAGAYGYYHLSGIKTVVDTARSAFTIATKPGDSHYNEALNFLRKTAKGYVSYFPGSGYLIDKAFDGLDKIVAAHGPEVNAVIKKGQDSIQDIIKRDGNEHKPSSALEVLSVIRQMLKEILVVGQKAGAPISERLELEKRINELGEGTAALFDSIVSKSPEIKARIGEYAEFAKAKSPEITAKMGEYAQSAKEYALPKAASLYETAKAKAPGVKDTLAAAAEKAKNAVFPPKDSE